ncbi:Uncharacterised protein [Mycolicibacterium tokaiense]|uniref:Uncharacterized protein n=1 Tax=Mycolicibacterium tokaiense TaxID=39695 RepID=A0A378TDU2_9MYCO|nr:Uncharacterised protein [Mycolicibacterium tokaiense]
MNDDREIIDVEEVELVETANLPALVGDEEESTPARMDTSPPPRWSERWWASVSPETRGRRCVGHKRDGNQCQKLAIKGATVCRTHGGATRHVKAAARVRIENAQNKLVGKLIQFAFDDTKPPEVQLRAIRDALDRGGLKPPAEVVLSQGESKPYESVFEGIYSGPPGIAPTDELPTGYTGYGPEGLEDAHPRPLPTPTGTQGWRQVLGRCKPPRAIADTVICIRITHRDTRTRQAGQNTTSLRASGRPDRLAAASSTATRPVRPPSTTSQVRTLFAWPLTQIGK